MNNPINNDRRQLQVCTQMRYAPNPLSCANSGSRAILSALEAAVAANRLDMDVIAVNCMLQCDEGPNIKLMPERVVWHHAELNLIPEIINACKKLVKTDCK